MTYTNPRLAATIENWPHGRERATMTLNAAVEAFENAGNDPSPTANALTAANLLTVATTYWNDDMISDETYSMYVMMVANDLHESVDA